MTISPPGLDEPLHTVLGQPEPIRREIVFGRLESDWPARATGKVRALAQGRGTIAEFYFRVVLSLLAG
jgi:hypothetical protein